MSSSPTILNNLLTRQLRNFNLLKSSSPYSTLSLSLSPFKAKARPIAQRPHISPNHGGHNRNSNIQIQIQTHDFFQIRPISHMRSIFTSTPNRIQQSPADTNEEGKQQQRPAAEPSATSASSTISSSSKDSSTKPSLTSPTVLAALTTLQASLTNKISSSSANTDKIVDNIHKEIRKTVGLMQIIAALIILNLLVDLYLYAKLGDEEDLWRDSNRYLR